MVAEWYRRPTCICGCATPLVRSKDFRRQLVFAPGHERRLQDYAERVLRGDAAPETIPRMAREFTARIKFLRRNPGLRRAFATPE